MATRPPPNGQPRPTGRPSMFTPQRRETILEAMRAGNYYHVCCEYSGVSRAAGYQWLQRGRDAITMLEEHGTPISEDDRPYVDFLADVTQARAQAETRLVALVSNAASEDWRAGVEILKRGFRDNWRDEAAVKHSGTIDVKKDESIARLDDVAAIMLESSPTANGASPNGHESG